MTRVVSALPAVTAQQTQQITSVSRTAASHRQLLADIPAMNMLEVGGTAEIPTLGDTVNVVAWNVERCLFPEKSAARLAQHQPQVVLLSEMDSGMARTGQRNTTAEMADHLGMRYAYGVEFHELDLGGPTERRFCQDDFNATGWHGNGILSAAPFVKQTLIRLDSHGHWFVPTGVSDTDEQPRVGGRMAVAAVINMHQRPVCFVSTHLESNADVAHRHHQFEVLLDAIDAFAPDMPVVIGGDLNTGNHLDDADWRRETLFDLARQRGYHWDANADGTTTRASEITPHPSRKMKLDWFACRGLVGQNNAIEPSVNDDGQVLSDHEFIRTTLRQT